MKKSCLIIILIILGFHPEAFAQNNNKIFTIYLVRHAEKDLTNMNHTDAPLTRCGEQRAESLSIFFRAVSLEAIYSTNYNRTKSTAEPTAITKKLEINDYDPEKLKDFSSFLLERKQDALVVGHSNTTAVLAGLLVNEELGEIDLEIYNRVYQVVICNDNGRLHLLHTSFECLE